MSTDTATGSPRTLLRKGDHHRLQLYEWAVQDPSFETEFLAQTFERLRGRKPRDLREDFCGTALLCAAWVRDVAGGTAVGIDLDGPTLEWGRKRHVAALDGDLAGRVTLLQQDVRCETRPRADIACAFNFSHFLFREPAELTDYYRHVRRSLRKDGLFFVDCYGGWESQQVRSEKRTVKCPAGRFRYVWHQDAYDPVTNEAECRIAFGFADGRRMKRAFTYHWRLYTLPELRQAMLDAGFSDARVYWDKSPDDDENDFRPARHAVNSAAWLAYVVGIV